MRRLLFGAAAAVALSATPAMADGLVFADIGEKKDVVVDISIVRNVDIRAHVFLGGEGVVEADWRVNRINTEKQACEDCVGKDDVIDDSVRDNESVISVNQTGAVAFAVGLGNVDGEGMVVVADADLGRFNVSRTVAEVNSASSATRPGLDSYRHRM